MLPPSALRGRILHIFDGLCAGTTATNAYERLQPHVQNELRPYVNSTDEVPIVASYISGQKWMLVTTSRLIVHQNNEHATIPWNDVVTCMPTDFVERRVNMELKTEGSRFTAITKDGKKHVFETEPGAAYLGIWNVVRAMSAK